MVLYMGRCSLTIFDGVNEIGGTKILVEHGDELFFLDFGKQHGRWLEFYEYPFSLPKTVDELIYLGLIPSPKSELKNLYTCFIGGEGSSIEGEGESKVVSCIFSHAHTDHTGYAFYDFLLPSSRALSQLSFNLLRGTGIGTI